MHHLKAKWALFLAIGAVTAAPKSCDRGCLEAVLDTFLTALNTHDAAHLPTTHSVKYVENSQVIPIGTGEWKIAGSPGKYRHVFADSKEGQVGTITTITENGERIIYTARLKVEPDGRVSEIETQLTRDAAGAEIYENNVTSPETVWLQSIPKEQRLSRKELITRTDLYYAGMERNNPHGNYSFFDKDCDRIEDALQTTNQKTGAAYGHSNDTIFASLGCEAQFQTGFLGFVTKIRSRRYPVVDEERQVVLAMMTLDHNGTVRYLPDVNGVMAPIPHYFDVPRSLQAAEAFKLHGNKLYRIEMTLTEVPYRMKSPFEPSDIDDLMFHDNTSSAKAYASPFPQPCDKACLEVVTHRVLEAMLQHRATDLPLADGALYTENGQVLEWNNGLWETLQKVNWPGPYRQGTPMHPDDKNRIRTDDHYAVQLSDPTTNTAAYWGLGTEQVTPGVLVVKIQLDKSGRIQSVDTFDVRAESVGVRGGTMTLMRPPLPVEWQGEFLGRLDKAFAATLNENAGGILEGLADTYFDGLERHSPLEVPFAVDCVRRDNGQTLPNVTCAGQMRGYGRTPNGLFNATRAVRDRQVLVSDHQSGIMLAVALVDSPAISPHNDTLPLPQRVPSTYLIPQLIKVDGDGAISHIESMIKWVPFGYSLDTSKQWE